jgi:Holliday junction DNA helicase RuvA
MIAFLRGRLIEKHPNRLIVDVNGVGYDVQVPLSTFYDLAEPGTEVSLRVHTHVREDQIALFGFGSFLEQQLFERLIGVSGIGPKLALAALSGIDPDDLVRAVRTADVARLSAVPGIGKKTAERITLELKDKLPAPSAPAGPTSAPPTPADDLRTDLLSALLNLGYHRPLAEKAVDSVLAKATTPPPFEQAVRAALRALAR